ncbi:DUF1778 domain-containing protein [Polycladidibacter hongkongensis]|uniref:type II toxin-antitoxin system TacA family antitoxin n=1 Tax=Polycladidibacter hongkongensis TaxID=1647556 RepID=UPI00082FF488|nr:DUF1778 domain-containing protein [Pseudovibrio hongkongensis]
MLDLNTIGLSSEKQTRTTQVRHGESLGVLIERATIALGVEKSAFLRSAIAKEAQRVLEASTRHVLTPEDAAQFSAALDSPPEPTPRAKKAAVSYRQRVTHAD